METTEISITPHKIIEYKAQAVEDRTKHLAVVKSILDILKSRDSTHVYPSHNAIDYLGTSIPETRTMVFDFILDSTNPVAAVVGIEKDDTFDLRWVFSAQPGSGIELIKGLMKKYKSIKIKASPYGVTPDSQETQLTKLVSYYEKLGFSKITDYKDIKYGGTIPMEWHV